MTERKSPSSQACPLCGATEHRPVRSFPDGVQVGRCLSCGLYYTPLRHPAPEGVLGTATLEELRERHGPILEGRARHYRHKNYRSYLEIVERYVRTGRLLDVGCAHGFFPRMARERGFDVTGVEPHPVMADFAERETGIPVLRDTIDDVELGDQSWDVVTFTDSLEYVPRPRESLARVREHLAPEGIVFVKVPNAHHARVRLALSRALPFAPGGGEAFGPSLRLAHYDLDTLDTLARAAGLRTVESGAVPPVDSPTWHASTGHWLELEEPWHRGLLAKLARRSFHWAGRLEALLTGGRNHLSPAIYAVLVPADEASSSTSR